MNKIISRSLLSLAGLALAAGTVFAADEAKHDAQAAPADASKPAEAAQHAAAAGHEIERQRWSFSGFKGQFDKGQLQRGFLVYKEVCSVCHGLKRLSFRNLSEPGGPEFDPEAVKALAGTWDNQIAEQNDEGETAVATKDKDGKPSGFKYVKRPPLPSDPILGPYANDKAARAAQNGALPPDLSIIAKARGVHREASPVRHLFLMIGDILGGYQEGGPDYIYALLTGYGEPPAGMKLGDGMNYNHAFPGNQLAMPPPLSDGRLTEKDHHYPLAPTVDNYARDVSAFLAWTADPSLNQRKRIGWQVMLYLLVTTVLLYLAKKRIWSKIRH
jgi:ubiquinol-cytochrome c reductase cytochrome c1 subunit